MVRVRETAGRRVGVENEPAGGLRADLDSPKVHLVDDDPAVRRAIALLIESAGFQVVTHPDVGSFLSQIAPNEFACVVLDMKLPGVHGMSLLQELYRTHRELPVVMISGQADIPTAIEAMRCGAVDFLEKPIRPRELIDRIVHALDIARREQQHRAHIAEIETLLGGLTPRETEVLKLLAGGQSVKEIAYSFGLSHKTVQVHRARILDQMRVPSLVDLANLLHEYDTIRPPTWLPAYDRDSSRL